MYIHLECTSYKNADHVNISQPTILFSIPGLTNYHLQHVAGGPVLQGGEGHGDMEKPQNHSRFGANVLKFDTCMHVDIEKPQRF